MPSGRRRALWWYSRREEKTPLAAKLKGVRGETLQRHPTTPSGKVCPRCHKSILVEVDGEFGCQNCGHRSKGFDAIPRRIRTTPDGEMYLEYLSREQAKAEVLFQKMQQAGLERYALGKSTQPVPQEAMPKSPPKKNKGGGRPRDVLVERRRRTIREVAATGVTGLAYVQAIHKAGLTPPPQWVHKEGCPKTYPEAYQQSKWAKRINREKSEYCKG